MKSTTLDYSFSYQFLWFVLSFYHYLVEEIPDGSIGDYYLDWSVPFEKLTSWAMDEWHFFLEDNDVSQENIALSFSLSLQMDDHLALYFGGELKNKAIDFHAKSQSLSSTLYI